MLARPPVEVGVWYWTSCCHGANLSMQRWRVESGRLRVENPGGKSDHKDCSFRELQSAV